MEFRILGPVELWSDGRRHAVGRTKERCVLAILAQTPGVPVPMEKLVNWLWDGAEPPGARANLHTYVSRLRARLSSIGDDATIGTLRPGGYVLQADSKDIDLHRFRNLRRQARAIAASGDDERALELLRGAHALVHGRPLADLSSAWADGIRRAIEDELLGATLERVEVELRLGHHTDLVSELRVLVEEHPYNEKLVEHLMKALYRAGRHADALTVYHDASHRLWKELQTQPCPELQELQARILRRDRTLLPVPRARVVVSDPRRTLPDDIRHFTGREEEVRALIEVASPTRPRRPTVIALDGMPGVGKTVLAVHLAHRLAEEYPDGQLYLDLHGLDAEQEATTPAAALDALLRMLGIQGVPPSVEERTALWRAELAGRRVLVVLDNARGREQIQPLLSSAPGCLTLITSRRRLVGLDDVWSHSIDVMSPSDAADLLERAIGPDRASPPGDIAEVVALCGHLPLAIQLVGNRLRHRRAWTSAVLAKRLAARNRRLAEIRAADREITAAFDLSYRGLAPRVRRGFRRLGLHLGADFALHGAAAITGEPPGDADRLIEELLDHHLLTEPMEGRYRFHALVRDYARQRAAGEDSESVRRDAVWCQLDHAVSAALLADRLLHAHGRDLGRDVPPPDPAPFATPAEADAWMTAEYANLLAAAEYAESVGALRHTALLAHALAGYLDAGGHWDRADVLHRRAVEAWRELGEAAGEAQALLDLSGVRFRTGQYGEALDHARASLEIYRSLGDARGEADVLAHRGLILWQRSLYRDALTSSRGALAIRRSLGDRRGEARVLDHIAIFLEFVGRYQEAADRRNTALEIYASIDDPRGLLMSLNNQGDLMLRLGRVDAARGYYEDASRVMPEMSRQHDAIWRNNMARIHLHTGRYDEALTGFRYALLTYRQIGDKRNEIETLIEIGTTYFGMGQHGEALIHFEQALAFSRRISEMFEQAKALRRIGEVLLADERLADADEAFREALKLAGVIGEPYERAKVLEGLGRLHLRRGARHNARRCWRQALRFFERAGMPSESETLRTLLEAV
ncbi:AfsR/SARP family transcriptional regulator [Actinoallomurus oryzae]|uniref:AfsR/SARP family transcriptional regulator n=1 Tax=Actinoallomurus oryzae TaxID=502180 RepID=UPI0031E8480D